MPSSPYVLLVCSAGGHLYQLYTLNKHLTAAYKRAWVCLKMSDSASLLKNEKVHWAYGPTNRSIKNLFRNLWLAWRLLQDERPDCIISTGAALAVPFLLLGRCLGIRTIYLESFAQGERLSLSGRMVYPFVHTFLVQSSTLAKRFSRAEYHGAVY